MNHYDMIAPMYEYATEKLHGQHRLEAVDLLGLTPGQSVLDTPCGTGANFPLLEAHIKDTGSITGVDYAQGMLNRASGKVKDAGWTNVSLLQGDAAALTLEAVKRQNFDAAICMLGLSVIPQWETAFERMYELLVPGGRFAVMDLYLDGKKSSSIANTYYKLTAQADSRRQFWIPLEARADNYTVIDHPWWGGFVRIAAGTKPVE